MSWWTSEPGRRHGRRRRARRALIARVDQEPVRKGRRAAASSSDFRTAMRSEIASHREWPKRRARVAVDLDLTTSQKQPPNLENLAKHYLDQLGETHDSGEGGHIYADDRQVQLLHVSAHHAWDPDGSPFPPGISVTARTASDAAADMGDAGQLPKCDDRYDIDDLEWDQISEQLDDADALSRSRSAELRGAAPLVRFTAIRNAQESLLRANDRWVQRLLWDGAPSLITGGEGDKDSGGSEVDEALRRFRESHDLGTRKILLGGDPASVALPSLPTAPGQGASFRRGVGETVRSYVDTRRLLFPLLVPVRLTLFVVQPDQPRDLDNILLEVLPAVDQIMKPPREPWLTSAVRSLDQIPEEDPFAEWTRRGLRRLRSIGEHGVWSCQVVELKRIADDPAEGILGMILGHGENMRSLWSEAADQLERRDERDDAEEW